MAEQRSKHSLVGTLHLSGVLLKDLPNDRPVAHVGLCLAWRKAGAACRMHSKIARMMAGRCACGARKVFCDKHLSWSASSDSLRAPKCKLSNNVVEVGAQSPRKSVR